MAFNELKKKVEETEIEEKDTTITPINNNALEGYKLDPNTPTYGERRDEYLEK